MKMAQTQGSSTYRIDSIRTEPSVTAHLHDLGLRKGSEVIILQKNHQGGILLYQDNRIALDTSVMERIDVTPILQEKTITSLDQLVVGEEARITSIAAVGALRRRLMDMGLTKKVPLKVVKLAPLGDPIEIRIRGYELSMRKDEAAHILVEKEGV
ncbi:ferrous iron transport protein A [Enterococcus sp. RIT-PI-f]|uniref:ferrous iron transport protein A n=1 Tax=Enterococcus sp. RIT-PI-f TaxID=1690244 RepID=UPI0006B9E845|nr:FeoA family protein [Enterococcus sp. RIT-PI-f]KPG68538.1 ferrous iron transporter A [Enterococcus sp. RIT-PI-f]